MTQGAWNRNASQELKSWKLKNHNPNDNSSKL